MLVVVVALAGLALALAWLVHRWMHHAKMLEGALDLVGPTRCRAALEEHDPGHPALADA